MKSILVFALPGFCSETLKGVKVAPPLAAYLETLDKKARSEFVNNAILATLENQGFDLDETGKIVNKNQGDLFAKDDVLPPEIIEQKEPDSEKVHVFEKAKNGPGLRTV